MKLSASRPILVVGANQQNMEKERTTERFVASEVTNECSEQVNNLGGFFSTYPGNRITLTNYTNNIDCKHVVQARDKQKTIDSKQVIQKMN